MNSKYYIIIASLLLVLNIALIIDRTTIVQQQQAIKFKPISEESSFTKTFFETFTFSFNDGGMVALVIINQDACLMCIYNEIELLNQFAHQQDKFMVLSIGSDRSFLEKNNLNLEYFHFNSLNDVFNDVNDISIEPVLMILDRNFIYDILKVNLNKPLTYKIREAQYDYAVGLLDLR
ncbi:MAG: hypothetical protein JJ895_00495 [Balneolaceae bacterium]|nr:hypothetical protein [Balneolaceae bacterium]